MKKSFFLLFALLLIITSQVYADKVYVHSVRQGAVIDKCFYNSGSFSYRLRCNFCGYTGTTSHKVSGTNGATISNFTCTRCGRYQSLFIRNETLRDTIPEECSDIFCHTVLQGGIITLSQPFAPDFYYRNKCERCGRISNEEYYASSNGGLTSFTFDCAKCKLKQTVTIYTYSEDISRVDLSNVYSHCAASGAIVTEYNPFSTRYGYREHCENCGYLSGQTLRTDDRSGERKSKFICPKCRRKQDVLIVTFKE